MNGIWGQGVMSEKDDLEFTHMCLGTTVENELYTCIDLWWVISVCVK